MGVGKGRMVVSDVSNEVVMRRVDVYPIPLIGIRSDNYELFQIHVLNLFLRHSYFNYTRLNIFDLDNFLCAWFEEKSGFL